VVPEDLIPRIKARGPLKRPEPSTPPDTTTESDRFVKAAPKLRGTTGSISAAHKAQQVDALASASGQPASQNPQMSQAQWPAMFPSSSSAPVFIMPQMVSSPGSLQRAFGYAPLAPPSSPTRPPDDGEDIETWLPRLDSASNNRGNTRYEDLLESFKVAEVHCVHDVTLFTAKEIVECTGCSIGMAKRILDRANMAMGIRR